MAKKPKLWFWLLVMAIVWIAWIAIIVHGIAMHPIPR